MMRHPKRGVDEGTMELAVPMFRNLKELAT